jgi:hypothetical protein
MQPQPIKQKPEPVKIEELKDAVEHIAFEMYYFVTYLNIRKESKNYLKFIKHPSPTDTVPRCVPQGMGYLVLLHFRVLYGFFYGHPEGDDCCVEHFKMLPEFAARFPAEIHVPPEGHSKIRTHINKLLAHFTAERWRNKRPPMVDYEAHFPHIVTLIARFKEALPPDYRVIFDAKWKSWEQGD